jgi:hypothetical protein
MDAKTPNKKKNSTFPAKKRSKPYKNNCWDRNEKDLTSGRQSWSYINMIPDKEKRHGEEENNGKNYFVDNLLVPHYSVGRHFSPPH